MATEYFEKIGNLRGADGKGVPVGGTQGQILKKIGNTDFATAWSTLNYSEIGGKVPAEALPPIGNATFPVDSEAKMLALAAVPGNMAIRTDLGKTFVLAQAPASTKANWVEMLTASDVKSVNGKVGAVVLTKADVGLGNVSNTADADKPVATQSTPGLFSAADKTKLDRATSSSSTGTLVSRDDNGDSTFGMVTLTKAPTANGHTATKAYVDGKETSTKSYSDAGDTAARAYADTQDAALKAYADAQLSSKVQWLGALGQNFNLNNYRSTGIGVQTTSAYATTALGYPIATAGLFQSFSEGVMVYQFYTTYHTSDTRLLWRTYYNGTWSSWYEVGKKEAIDAVAANLSKTNVDLLKAIADGDRPANFQLSELQGGQKLTSTIPAGVGWASGNLTSDLDSRRDFAQTGVIEGWVKGVPVGGPVGSNGVSAGFVKDPVWKVEIRPEGLGYVTQRIELLNCLPKFMVGFAWERTYDPASTKWTAWACVGGDTLDIFSVGSTPVASATTEQPFIHNTSSTSGQLYSSNGPFTLRRIGSTVYFTGAATATSSGLTGTNTDSAANLGWFVQTSESAADVPGADYTLIPYKFDAGVQQGSGTSRWCIGWYPRNSLRAYRYDGTPGSKPWLYFNIAYPAPPINTYPGAGLTIPTQISTQPAVQGS